MIKNDDFCGCFLVRREWQVRARVGSRMYVSLLGVMKLGTVTVFRTKVKLIDCHCSLELHNTITLIINRPTGTEV